AHSLSDAAGPSKIQVVQWVSGHGEDAPHDESESAARRGLRGIYGATAAYSANAFSQIPIRLPRWPWRAPTWCAALTRQFWSARADWRPARLLCCSKARNPRHGVQFQNETASR